MKFAMRPVRPVPAQQWRMDGFGSFMNASRASSY